MPVMAEETTGTFTIPLMRQIGFPAEKAGAVEVASSTNGQLTPPIMGAAAFLMIEFIGISYTEVIRHAFLPAVIAYIALVYIVHLEACKKGMQGLPGRRSGRFLMSLFNFMTVLVGLIVLTFTVYYGLGWIKDVAGEATFWVIGALLLVAYLGLLKLSTCYPELGRSDEIDELPPIGPVVKSGLYFLLPVVVLVWCLTVERMSPGLSAFWATMMMIFELVTHKPLKDMMRGDGHGAARWMEGIVDLKAGLVAGARNMIGIGIATATAGVVIGTVTLTGVGLVMAEFVEFISGGNLMLMLLFTAGISLLLGMGLPTTANYIVVSSLMAPVILTLGAKSGLIVPLIAVHLFVFYFGFATWFNWQFSAMWVCVVVFVLWGTAEMGDLVRAAITSIDQHQRDSAYALGLTHVQALISGEAEVAGHEIAFEIDKIGGLLRLYHALSKDRCDGLADRTDMPRGEDGKSGQMFDLDQRIDRQVAEMRDIQTGMDSDYAFGCGGVGHVQMRDLATGDGAAYEGKMQRICKLHVIDIAPSTQKPRRRVGSGWNGQRAHPGDAITFAVL